MGILVNSFANIFDVEVKAFFLYESYKLNLYRYRGMMYYAIYI